MTIRPHLGLFGGGSPILRRGILVGVGTAVTCQVALLVIAGWHNRHMINPDAVAYIRIASYYATRQMDLMVSGYWGPMLSWLMAPLLSLFESPLDAARVAMGLSALVFLWGSTALFRALEIPAVGIALGAWLVALTSIYWSVAQITPDLLVGGLMLLAVSQIMSRRWLDGARTPLTAGLTLGAAYLAKAVALPVAFGSSLGIAFLWVISRQATVKAVAKSLSLTVLALLLVAAPWVTVISLKYRALTISTSAGIAHALVGPPDKERFHPLGFYPPESGRLWWGEDPPPSLHRDRYWSPLESRTYAKHQLKVIYYNAKRVLQILAGFDALNLGVIAIFVGLIVHRPWRDNLRTDRWRWAAVPVAAIIAIYLPVLADEERYYYPVYPFLVAASIGMIVSLTRTALEGLHLPGLAGLTLIAISFMAPVWVVLPDALNGIDYPPAAYACDLAKRLRAVGIHGTIVGAGGYENPWGGEYVGPYLAFFTHQPYYGAEKAPSAAAVTSLGAALVVIDRKLPLTTELDQDGAVQSLDRLLFASHAEAANYPLKAYQVRTVRTGRLEQRGR